MSLTKSIIKNHMVEGTFEPGSAIAIKIDQTLTQDATGTLAYLEFESLGLGRVRTETSVSFVDHNLLQADPKNADDHAFLRSVAARFGVWFSEPGNGICHQVQLERFAAPGKTVLGSDSHTPNAGAIGCLAMGAGGLDVAASMAGQAFHLTCPRVMGVKLVGSLPDWVSGKDVIHELLRRLSVKGGLGWVLEYFGPAVEQINMAHRATICHMGAELGATGSVFPCDEVTRAWLAAQGREGVFSPMVAGGEADFDRVVEVDLSELEPLMALSPSPDNVVPVAEMAGQPVGQVIIGSSGNSGWYDLALTARVLDGKTVAPGVSFEINPGSRQVLSNLAADGSLEKLISAGARIHQPGCLGCIGMGQAPASGTISLRTFPRNFAGRSGTPNDQVHLVSPETAVASALSGVITDPRTLGTFEPPAWPEKFILNDSGLFPPLTEDEAAGVEIVRGPHIAPFPILNECPEDLTAQVVIRVGDNITTDDIMPGGAKVLPWRSNIDRICRFAYSNMDDCFADRADEAGSGVIVGGENYGQGSSREHAALGPRHLGIRVKMARSFARIHRANLINFGVLPLTFTNPADYEAIEVGQEVSISGIRQAVLSGATRLTAIVGGREVGLKMDLDERQRALIAAGGLLNYIKNNS